MFRNKVKLLESNGLWQFRWQSFLLLFCIVPTVLYTAYLMLLASPQYTSEFRIQIKSPNALQSVSIGALLGLAGGASPTSDAGYAVTQYLESPAAWKDLDRRIRIQSMYDRVGTDWFHRLDRNAPIEEKVRYWKKRLDAHFETTTLTVTVRVSAFTPEEAERISQEIFKLSEKLLNDMSMRARADRVKQATAEVDDAQARVQDVEQKLLVARRRSGVIDPAKQVTLDLSRVADLQRAVDQAQIEVNTWGRYLSADAPAIAAAKAKLSAAQDELARVKVGNINGNGGGTTPLPPTIKAFSELEIARDYAMKRFEAAMANLNGAQMDAERQQLYFDTIVGPQRPQQQSYPAYIRDVATVFVLSLAVTLLFLFLAEITMDHTKI